MNVRTYTTVSPTETNLMPCSIPLNLYEMSKKFLVIEIYTKLRLHPILRQTFFHTPNFPPDKFDDQILG